MAVLTHLVNCAAVETSNGSASCRQRREGTAVFRIKYSATSAKGRKIFGGVVPYNQVWRIGEGSGATLHTDSDLVFCGLSVPAGDYSLYVLVDPNKWQLIINKQTGAKAGAYYASDREW